MPACEHGFDSCRDVVERQWQLPERDKVFLCPLREAVAVAVSLRLDAQQRLADLLRLNRPDSTAIDVQHVVHWSRWSRELTDGNTRAAARFIAL